MYTRLEDTPVYEFRDTELSAIHYNHVQIALHRLNSSIRLELPKLKHLDLILEESAWIVVDKVLNDVPIVAWTEFQTEHRSDIHSPIQCKLRIYHAHAGLILSRTLEAMELILGEQLDKLDDETNAKILTFVKK